MEDMILPLQILTEQFARLPGVGRKTAKKYAYSFIELSPDRADEFISALSGAREKVTKCRQCFNYADRELCPLCSDQRRDPSIICVVEDARNISVFEKPGVYNGLYHVLGGVISPMKGIGPDKLHIQELISRVKASSVSEVILAMNPNLEGETTAMYISGLLADSGAKITRLAYGIPAGADLEYTDEVTLAHALEDRKQV